MLPLLHVAQSASELITVDRSVLASALAGMGATILAIWRPRNWRRLHVFRSSRARRRVAGAIAGAAMFIAVLPMLLPLDHVFAPHVHSGGEQQVHASHCHESPGSCSDMPLLSGPGQFLASEPLIVTPAFVSVLLVFGFAPLIGITHKPPVPPPLRLTAAA
jgi:hypothetical protein